MTDAVLARAADDGYVLVGPSARTWRRDPDTGRPTVAVSDAEHQTVRDLLGRYTLDTTEPEWVLGPDGQDDIHSTVVPAHDAAHAAAADATSDDPGELAARVGALHEQSTAGEYGVPVPYCRLIDTSEEELRREQLARWHDDDTTDGDAADVRVLDDGPGLP